MSDDKQYPDMDDPVGTRYIRDGDGEIIVDRRGEQRGRLALIYTCLALLFAIAGLSGLGTIREARESDREAKEQAKIDYDLRASQRLGCEASNELRGGVRRFIHGQIENLRTTDPAHFPDIPPEVLASLLTDRIAQYRRLIRREFRDLNCQRRFPYLDDPDTEENEAGT